MRDFLLPVLLAIAGALRDPVSVLRSRQATILVLCVALMAQIPHAADVFRLILGLDSQADRFHSYLFAVGVELAVLKFVVDGHRLESWIFALFSVVMNLAYYAIHGVRILDPAMAWPAYLVSLILPLAIALYSHSLTQKERERPSVRILDARKERAPEMAAGAAPEAAGEVEAINVRKREREALPAASESDGGESAGGAIVAALRNGLGGSSTAPDLARHLGVAESTVYRNLKTLETAGAIVREREGRQVVIKLATEAE